MANGHLPHVEATLLRKGKPVLTKRNSLKTHPFLAKFAKFPFQHAETATILSYGLDNCVGLDLYVTRYRRDGKVSMAKPCKTCQKIIELVGIRNVYYTDWSGNIKSYKVTKK